jgi:hypothetical protein
MTLRRDQIYPPVCSMRSRGMFSPFIESGVSVPTLVHNSYLGSTRHRFRLGLILLLLPNPLPHLFPLHIRLVQQYNIHNVADTRLG